MIRLSHQKQHSLQSNRARASLYLILGLLVCVGALSACSIGYVMRAAFEEGKILAARRKIDSVINDPKSNEDEKIKLALVLDARAFAISIGLTPRDSFTKYTRVDRDVLAWVLLASKPDAFQLYTWWYPVVGRVPYKGFFEVEDARSYARGLDRSGYEYSIRGTEAFSTLGWFNDPVLSTSLRHSPTRIANTVLHESFHSTTWIPGHVDFNESAANFLGSEAAVAFFRSRAANCTAPCQDQDLLASAILERDRELDIGDAVEALYADLDSLYQSAAPSESKIALRNSIFERHMANLRVKYPDLKLLRELNNAELIQLKLYLTKLRSFEALYHSCASDWSCFLGKMQSIKKRVESAPQLKPFDLLDDLVKSSASPKALL